MRLRCLLLLAVLFLAGCARSADPPANPTAILTPEPTWAPPVDHLTPRPLPAASPGAPVVELSLAEKDVQLAPQPIRAGVPFTVTVTVHNHSQIPAERVPVMLYLSPVQDQIGFQPFLAVITTTVPATRTASVRVPVNWNLAGGEHQLWVRVNDIPRDWLASTPVLPEARLADNAVLVQVMVQPFDALISDVCAGRLDVALHESDVWMDPDLSRVHVRVHNLGNQAAYHLPVIVTGGKGIGMAYTPAIPPCGGTAEVTVVLDQAMAPAETFQVQLNPEKWPDGLAEDDFGNNQVSAVVGSTATGGPSDRLADYDFKLDASDVDLSQPGIVVLTIHNLGTRDAAMVPVRIEGKSGRKLTDAIPVVEGGGLGVGAIQLNRLWAAGATLTIIVNPPGAQGGYPESERGNNSVVVTIPK